MSNGYESAMRVFTKISKVPFVYLRRLGQNSVVHVNDSYLQGETYQACLPWLYYFTKKQDADINWWKQYPLTVYINMRYL